LQWRENEKKTNLKSCFERERERKLGIWIGLEREREKTVRVRDLDPSLENAVFFEC